LVVNLATGVIQARALGTDGRGSIALVVSWAFMWQFLINLGFREGLVFVHSTDARRAREVLKLGLLSSVAMGCLGFLLAQLTVGPGYRAQEAELVNIARVGMLLIPIVLFHETMTSLAAASQRFVFFGLSRFAQPAMFAIGLIMLSLTGRLTVSTALVTIGATYFLAAALIWVVLRQAVRHEADVLDLTEPTSLPPTLGAVAGVAGRFGLRTFGYSLGGVANARLDLMLMSAVLLPSDAGIYVVAVSVASIVVGLFMPLRHVVFAAAARRGLADGAETVATVTRITAALATMVALALGLAAPMLITLVYGEDFRESATVVRLLLPGLVLWTASGIVAGGLNARDLPGKASFAQIIGLIVTVFGLLIALRPFGINGAALVSTASYTTVFVLATLFYVRSTNQSVATFLSPRSLARDVRTLIFGQPLLKVG